KITAFAIGNPSEAFDEPYRVFDEQRKIARLPGPPFQFLDRIVAINGEPWKLVEGVTIEAEYDVPADAWYFSAGRQPCMPFSVLLEIALQPCGWLAAYLGSALTSKTDLSFRNLDGQATVQRMVTPQSGTLTTAVKITKVAGSGGMIIQGYSFEVSDAKGPVYSGTTVF
ncbi:MAG: 3-hydroxyacyl-ACP dehydratase FabZ family protein, partial [Desulfotignum sp.]